MRVPELALGLLLIAVCAFAALLWNRSLTSGRTVVVAAGDISRGSVISAADLAPAEVRGADTVTFLSGDAAVDVLGTVALVDIAAGEPLSSGMVASTRPLGADEGLAGLAVERGQAPADLAPGDTVRIVVVPDVDPVEGSDPTLLEMVAEVWSIDPATEYQPTAVVTVRLPIADAASVAGADSVRLVRVDP